MITAEDVWARVDRRGADECWPWIGSLNVAGRGRVPWRGRERYAYRVTWELANGELFPDELVARHSCDNPTCVNPKHIEPGTQADNNRDMFARGRITKKRGTSGAAHHMVRHSPSEVLAAVEAYRAGGRSQADVAAEFGISQPTLGKWVRGEYRKDGGQQPIHQGKGHARRLT